MKIAIIALLCLAAAVVAEPDPHYYPYRYGYHYPYYHSYYHHPHHPYHHHVKPLKGEGVAKHPGGATSFVADRVHGLTKRSADPEPAADPEPVADPEAAADPHNSYSYQVVHRGYPHYYPHRYGYRHGHYYGYPYTRYAHHVHKRSADPEPEPHYARSYNYGRYYHGYPGYYRYPYYRGYYHG